MDPEAVSLVLAEVHALLAQQPLGVELNAAFSIGLVHPHATADDPRRRLIDVLLAQAALLPLFQQIHPQTKQQANLVGPASQLAFWLIKRAKRVGPALAVADLADHLRAKSITLHDVLAIAGLRLDKPVDLGGGVSIVPWDDVPDHDLKHLLAPRLSFSHDADPPTAALMCAFVVPKPLTLSSYSMVRRDRANSPSLVDTLLAASLAGRIAPRPVALFVVPSSNTRDAGGGSASGFSRRESSRLYEWMHTWDEPARELCGAFRRLPGPGQDRLRVPLTRLSQSAQRSSVVDAFADLGIALESLLLSDMHGNRGELTFRIALLGSRFLGSEPIARKELFRTIKTIYKARSSAVHTGRLGPNVEGIPTRDLLEIGQQVCTDLLLRFIREGYPDWQSVLHS